MVGGAKGGGARNPHATAIKWWQSSRFLIRNQVGSRRSVGAHFLFRIFSYEKKVAEYPSIKIPSNLYVWIHGTFPPGLSENHLHKIKDIKTILILVDSKISCRTYSAFIFCILSVFLCFGKPWCMFECWLRRWVKFLWLKELNIMIFMTRSWVIWSDFGNMKVCISPPLTRSLIYPLIYRQW